MLLYVFGREHLINLTVFIIYDNIKTLCALAYIQQK